MAKTFEFDGIKYSSNLDIDVDAIIEKIKKASAGESVPGVAVFQLPNLPAEETQEAGISMVTMLLLGALAFVVLKPKAVKK